jgi:hypothetical protein
MSNLHCSLQQNDRTIRNPKGVILAFRFSVLVGTPFKLELPPHFEVSWLQHLPTWTMVNEMNYATISHVIEDWESVKRTKDYEKVAGTKLFRR